MDAALHTAVNRHRMAKSPVNGVESQQKTVDWRQYGRLAETLGFPETIQKQLTELTGKVDALAHYLGITEPKLPAGPSIGDIKQAVCREYGISHVELLGVQRYARVLRPRQIAMYLSAKLTGKSLSMIGREFDRVHTTIFHCRRLMENRRAKDRKLDVELMGFEAKLALSTPAPKNRGP